MAAPQYAHLYCPSISSSVTRTKGANTVELRPFLHRDQVNDGFVGGLYVKEVRVVEDQECHGVSVSTLAFGVNKKKVVEQIAAEARKRAQQYTVSGYKVALKKLSAA